ncbi:MAG: hypothetical protein ACREEQ_12105, partial [Caulobacteraceae bacterium]
MTQSRSIAPYAYASLTLRRVPTPHLALAKALKARAADRNEAGAEIVGQFSPQLGWAADEAAVLLRWIGQRGDAKALLRDEPVASARVRRLWPTIRPADGVKPTPGGVHVHRWFEVEEAAADEFVALSGEGWTRFEALFDARIFGLFRAQRSAAQRKAGLAPFLLITRYGDHGVWEASRDPSTEAMRIFMRRQQLTRRSWAA